MSKAPWTPEQTAALNLFQKEGWMHPFTCPHDHGSLIALESGWICTECLYTQDWAHGFMFEDLSIAFGWPSPLTEKPSTGAPPLGEPPNTTS